jgi:glutamate-1-semialdehyde 2,1-aminomutase
MNFRKSEELQKKSHSLIPGGCHTYAKGDDQYPVNAPGFIVRGKGCRVWDPDGNEFIEYGMGLRSVTLGHAYEPVVEAARRQMQLGNNFTRPSVLEIQCAEEMLSLIPGADMIKFAKNGSDATTAAVKLARAYTGRDMVAICSDQPFFSVDDWFIGTTAMSAGIPDAIKNLSVTFKYNDISSLEKVFDSHPGKVACVIMEAATAVMPEAAFLEKVKDSCRHNGALLILDEMITGFRWALGGAQSYYGIQPDLSVFGKGMGNGFSVAALMGKRKIMELGGLHHDRERVFLLSTTHGAEGPSLAAALETISIYKKEDVVQHLNDAGTTLKTGIDKTIEELKLRDHFQVTGMPSNLIYVTRDQDGNPSQDFRTLFLQENIKRGVLGPSFVVSYSHGQKDIESTVEAVSESLLIYRKALEEGVEKHLVGRPVQPVLRKYN